MSRKHVVFSHTVPIDLNLQFFKPTKKKKKKIYSFCPKQKLSYAETTSQNVGLTVWVWHTYGFHIMWASGCILSMLPLLKHSGPWFLVLKTSHHLMQIISVCLYLFMAVFHLSFYDYTREGECYCRLWSPVSRFKGVKFVSFFAYSLPIKKKIWNLQITFEYQFNPRIFILKINPWILGL